MMDRRGFLGALGAFTGALASGVRMPTGREVPPPPVPVTDDFLAPEKTAAPAGNSAQEMLMQYLPQCEVVRIDHRAHVGGYEEVCVTYRYREGLVPLGRSALKREADALTAGRRPVGATVTTFAEPLDITTFGGVPIRTDLAEYEIEVTWA